MAASPEIAGQTIRTFEQATEANRATGNRQGNVILVGPDNADELMVTADLHGHRIHFDRLLEVADLPSQPRRQLVMQEVCHGGPSYPSSSGCMSHLLLEDVARLKCEYPNRFHFLLSNHEWAEWADFPITKSSRILNLSFRCGLQEMYGAQAESVRKALLRFIESCPLAVRLDGSVFICHSAPENVDRNGFDASVFARPLSPEDLAVKGPVFRLVWGRDFRLENAEAFARLVNAEVLIHGHEPCDAGYRLANERQIILDCCGPAACYVVLPTGRPHSVGQVVGSIRTLEWA